MQHLLAFLEAGVAALTNTQINALADNWIRTNNNNFFIPQKLQINWAAGIGAVAEEFRLSSPTLRQIALPQIVPITIGAVVGGEPRVADYRGSPFELKAGEELQAQATVGAVGGTQVLLLGLSDGPLEQPPQGNISTLRGNSTTAAVANVWTDVSASLVFDDNVPPGRYAIVGIRVRAAGIYAARLILRDGTSFRPGAVGVVSNGDQSWPGFLKGGMGVLGYFDSDILPGLEVLENAATADHDVFLDIVPVGPRRAI